MSKNKNSTFRILKIFVALLLLVSCSTSKTDIANTSVGKNLTWTGTWATAPQLVEPHNMPPSPGLSDNTLRQIVRVSIGGDILRLRFSNVFSKQPVTIKSSTIALSEGGSVIDAATESTLKFNGKDSVTMVPGGEIISDPLKYKLAPNSRLAITVAFGETSPDVTGHPGSRTTSYILEGNQISSVDFADAVPTDHWYVINGIDVQTSSKAACIAILGNSITDGRGSGTNKQNRWTDIFSEQLLKNKATQNIGVLNMGIGGNCIVRGGLGPTALSRFDRDILSQSNVHWLIILEGVNDIGGIPNAEIAPKVVENLIDAYTQMIDKAHEKGIKVYGATILPFAKSFYDKDFRLTARDSVNQWIRTSRKFDAVIDFDKLMRDPSDPETILPNVHDGDYLHPNEYGYKKMGEFIDLNLF